MSKLVIQRKQYIDSKFVNWYIKVNIAILSYLSNKEVEIPVCAVKKLNGNFLVKIKDITDVCDDELAFRLPENRGDYDYPVVVAWLVQKIMNWQCQVK